MITVGIKQLVSAIEEAEVFSLPDMNEGTHYLYDELYGRLSRGAELRLSEIDWGSFELDDIDSMRKLYSGTLEANESRADTLVRTLRSIPPVAAVSAFV